MPDDEAGRVPALYEEHLAALGPRLPNDARRLATDVSLHDGLLRGVERAGNRFEIVFRAGDLQVGYFDARLRYEEAELPASDEQFLRSAVGCRAVELLYDEFDSSQAEWVHRFLFWPYREVTVRFRTFTLAVSSARARFDDAPRDNNPL